MRTACHHRHAHAHAMLATPQKQLPQPQLAPANSRVHLAAAAREWLVGCTGVTLLLRICLAPYDVHCAASWSGPNIQCVRSAKTSPAARRSATRIWWARSRPWPNSTTLVNARLRPTCAGLADTQLMLTRPQAFLSLGGVQRRLQRSRRFLRLPEGYLCVFGC